MKIDWVHKAMVRRRMVLGEAVCKIVSSWDPENVELALLGAIPHPIKRHVHSARALLFDSSIEDAICDGIVNLHGSCRLGMAHFGECGAKYDNFFSIEKSGSDFGFGCGGNNMSQDLGNMEDGSIGGLVVGHSVVS
jgi:hypothetical protein